MAACQGRPKKFNAIAWSVMITSQQIMKITLNRNMDKGELDMLCRVQHFKRIAKTNLFGFFTNDMKVAVSIFSFLNS